MRIDHADPGPTMTVTQEVDEPPRDEPARINLSWLLRLRWGAAMGQLATIWVSSRWLQVDLPLLPLHALVAAELASNLACALWLRRAHRVPEPLVGALMALDVLLLTGLFSLSGGASNPFTPLYLVYIALAAVVLRPAWTWSLVVLSLACFAALFLEPLEAGPHAPGGHAGPHAGEHAMPHGGSAGHGEAAGLVAAGAHGSHLQLHLQGMWVAFGVGATFIVYFVQRVSRALAERERELADARAVATRAERLASLATLAAGAAHELSTPLSTIAVVTRELERQLGRTSADEATLADVQLIREQVERCREILVQMAADAGESTGEDFAPVCLEALVGAALRDLPEASRVRLSMAPGAGSRELVVPARAVAQALRAVIKNALQATAPQGLVELDATAAAHECRIEVRDSGAGMPPEILVRAFDPFFTTKPTGKGMGLGLFLARDVIERVGGRLDLRSAPGHGTVAMLRFPLDSSRGLGPHGAAAEITT